MENKGTLPSLHLPGFPSALLLFLPLKSDISGWFVFPCPCGGPGMVTGSALHYLCSLTRAQAGVGDLNTPRGKEAELGGVRPAQPPRKLQKACCACSPVRGSLSPCSLSNESSPWALAPSVLVTPGSAPLPPTRVPTGAPPCGQAKLVL